MRCTRCLVVGLSLCLGAVLISPALSEDPPTRLQVNNLNDRKDFNELEPTLWQIPDPNLKAPLHKQVPIVFVTRNDDQETWEQLKSFWNQGKTQSYDPASGNTVEHAVVQIKVPLGLSQAPPVPAENPLTVAKWQLGKQLYYDPILSTDNTVACASCHNPEKGFGDQLKTSMGIGGQFGGMNAPTVIDSAYNQLQFWDGRAASLEAQAQGPPTNPVEMFGGTKDPEYKTDPNHAWNEVVRRVRAKPSYVKQFQTVFGTPPTQDAVAKAIAAYERTVLSADALADRANLAMLERVEESGDFRFEIKPEDFATVIKQAVEAKDGNALKAIDFDPKKDMKRLDATAQSIFNGMKLFSSKARCNSCHVGDTFTDHAFHNLGVGAKDGILPTDVLGRYGAQPLGAKDPQMVGAFKTPPLRALLDTAPYMHDGSEKTLEQVVDFYDRGGNPNEFLDTKMRDTEAEDRYKQCQKTGQKYEGPEVFLCGPRQVPIVPLKLNLSDQEKKDLILYMKALQGDPVDPIVADPNAGVQ